MRKICFLLLALLSTVIVMAQTYICNVTLLDVENMKLVPGLIVTVNNGIITAITFVKKTTAAPGADIIDGTGKFFMPGMTDAHIHFFQSGGLYTRPDALDLRKFKSYDTEMAWTHDNIN